MAKLNWQRLHEQQREERYRHSQALADAEHRYRNIWLIGKHRGKQVRELPDHYLHWTQENLPPQNAHRLKAFKEITRRQHRHIKRQKIQHTRLAGQS